MEGGLGEIWKGESGAKCYDRCGNEGSEDVRARGKSRGRGGAKRERERMRQEGGGRSRGGQAERDVGVQP